jgi:hypothetical protein
VDAARKAVPKKRGREGVLDAESMGLPGRSTNAGAEPMRALADAGMVLRDPSTMQLIIHHVRVRLLMTFCTRWFSCSLCQLC